MVEYLVKDPNKLYEICNYRDLEEYYPFSFIGNFNSIEVARAYSKRITKNNIAQHTSIMIEV